MVVEGNIFERAALNTDFNSSVTRRLIISSEEIGFQAWYDPGGEVESTLDIGESLGRMPFWQIVRFLLGLERQATAMSAVKTFPKSLRAVLEESSAKYSTQDYHGQMFDASFENQVHTLEPEPEWENEYAEVYQQELVFHRFETSFYEVSLRIHTFESMDLAEESGAS